MHARKKSRQSSQISASGASTRPKQAAETAARTKQIHRDFVWDIVAVNIHFEDIRRIWAELLGVTGPQWMILMAINDLDIGQGVSVGDVSTKIRVNPPFVTTQTKILEKSGLLTRTASPSDARSVLMSLTDKAHLEIAKFSAKRNELFDFIFADVSDRTLRDIAVIRRKAEKAALQLDLDRS
jgi:DNA-binding MarR family transcriptional regulator